MSRFRKDSEFRFQFETFDVYRVAREFAHGVQGLPLRGQRNRKDQLERAADSVLLNIAEGSSKPPGRDRQRHYRYAFASAGECVAVLQLLELRKISVLTPLQQVRRVAAMLNRMLR